MEGGGGRSTPPFPLNARPDWGLKMRSAYGAGDQFASMAQRNRLDHLQHVGFSPDWEKHGRAAPFKRNDAMLDVLPIGVIVFPGTGIQDFADKARKLGINAYDFRNRGGA